MSKYEAIIGLEIHIQLNTNSKIFCACKADSWGDPPNTNICPVCTGQPGVLPVPNQAVIDKGALLAAALHAEVQPVSYFDRKRTIFILIFPRVIKSPSMISLSEKAVTWTLTSRMDPAGVWVSKSCTSKKTLEKRFTNQVAGCLILIAAESPW